MFVIRLVAGFMLLVTAVYGGIIGGKFVRYRRTAKGLRRQQFEGSRILANPQQHVLVAGDSTMVSAGVDCFEDTIAGLMAQRYPKASVELVAGNGARCRDVRLQLDRTRQPHYDLLLLGIGGNDVVRLTTKKRLQQDLHQALQAASHKARRVIVCNSVNVGNIGFFPYPLNHLYDRRSRQFSELCQEIVRQFNNVQFVNFYRPLHDDHYDAGSRHLFVAADGFHANAHANRHFFDLIRQQADL